MLGKVGRNEDVDSKGVGKVTETLVNTSEFRLLLRY